MEEACEAELSGDLLDAAKTIRKFLYSKLTTTTTTHILQRILNHLQSSSTTTTNTTVFT